MKKFLTLFGSLSLAISASLPVTSCSSPNKSKTPTKPTTNLLIQNNIKDFFSARKFLAKQFNLKLDEFTMTWTSSQTVRLVPMPGTSLRNTMTSLVDYRLDSGYNSISKNESLSTLKNECPLTKEELKIPYMSSLEHPLNTAPPTDKQTLANDYFNVLKYMSGKEMDANIYTYSYKNASDQNNPNLKGILTVVNKNDSTDTVDVNVEKNAIPVDKFFDCNDIYKIYLPEAMTNITKDNFSLLGAGESGPFQAFMNYYFATGNYANNFYGYYKDDIVNLFTVIMMPFGPGNNGISIKKTLDSSGEAGVLNFTLKNNKDNYSNDSGIISSDEDGNIFNININFTTVMPDTDEYDYYARYIIQRDANGKEQTNLWDTSSGVNLKYGPVKHIKDLTSEKESKDKFSKTNIGKDYLTEYEFDEFKLKNPTESDIDIKKEFVNKLNSVTGSKLDFGVFLDDEISLIKEDDGYYYLAPKFGSRVMSIMQKNAMVNNFITITPLVPKFQNTIGSYVFRVNVQNN
ncbi:hypothetical protein [Spiroplasma endosymbiont of Aspidapion aeneum]|uniref:hypothetical protein n=1 Tax=Spiroplasma endosymbiont of Aspidapion aeneum TaxID=3066276 RepID=UPI00313B138B